MGSYDELDGWGIVACIFMAEWALIHLIGGVLSGKFSFSGDVAGWHCFIMEQVGKKKKAVYDATEWPVLANRIPMQHSMNLFIVGILAIIAVVSIANRSECALMACVGPFLFDVSYFIAIDIPAAGGPVGEAQTFIVSTAVLCASVSARHRIGGWQFIVGILAPIAFIIIAATRALAKQQGKWPGALDNEALTQPLTPDAGKDDEEEAKSPVA